MNEERLEKVESYVAHLEQQMSELGETVHDLWKDQQRLRAELSRAKQKIEQIGQAQGDGEQGAASLVDMLRDDVPPHF